jgi:hypothetical protein
MDRGRTDTELYSGSNDQLAGPNERNGSSSELKQGKAVA